MTVVPTPATMTFTHFCAWRVIGGIGMPATSNTVPLSSGVGWSYALTNDIDAACATSDRAVVELSDLLMKYLAAHAAQALGNQKGN